MSWFNIGDKAEDATGRVREVTGLSFSEGVGSPPVIKLKNEDGTHTDWLWSSQFEKVEES